MRICGNCEYNDGFVYTSLPPMMKCTITKEFHRNDHACELEFVPVVRCKDCRWGKKVSGNVECRTDINVPPEYHGYEWFCPNGERKDE